MQIYWTLEELLGGSMDQNYLYDAKLKEIIDGDTVDLVVDLGFNCKLTERFRMEDLDCPETWRPQSEIERVAGIKCKEYLTRLLTENGDRLVVQSLYKGIYGRFCAYILYWDPAEGKFASVNDMMQQFMDENRYNKSEIRKAEQELLNEQK